MISLFLTLAYCVQTELPGTGTIKVGNREIAENNFGFLDSFVLFQKELTSFQSHICYRMAFSCSKIYQRRKSAIAAKYQDTLERAIGDFDLVLKSALMNHSTIEPIMGGESSLVDVLKVGKQQIGRYLKFVIEVPLLSTEKLASRLGINVKDGIHKLYKVYLKFSFSNNFTAVLDVVGKFLFEKTGIAGVICWEKAIERLKSREYCLSAAASAYLDEATEYEGVIFWKKNELMVSITGYSLCIFDLWSGVLNFMTDCIRDALNSRDDSPRAISGVTAPFEGKFDDCPICSHALDVPRPALLLTACRHYLHENCAIGFFKTKRTCPVCHTDLSRNSFFESLVESDVRYLIFMAFKTSFLRCFRTEYPAIAIHTFNTLLLLKIRFLANFINGLTTIDVELTEELKAVIIEKYESFLVPYKKYSAFRDWKNCKELVSSVSRSEMPGFAKIKGISDYLLSLFPK